jgi:hypothetical protein
MARGKGGRVAMCVYKRGKVWWYRFTWNAEAIRESTKQTNKRVAEQIEAAHKTSLAKGEVGIRDRAKVPMLKDFIQQKFSPYIEARFLTKSNTLDYYRAGIKKPYRFRTARELQVRQNHRTGHCGLCTNPS